LSDEVLLEATTGNEALCVMEVLEKLVDLLPDKNMYRGQILFREFVQKKSQQKETACVRVNDMNLISASKHAEDAICCFQPVQGVLYLYQWLTLSIKAESVLRTCLYNQVELIFYEIEHTSNGHLVECIVFDKKRADMSLDVI
jgi:hypothetical protein